MKSYVTFFAHPDDEILAIGATLHRRQYDHLHFYIPATGITARTKIDQYSDIILPVTGLTAKIKIDQNKEIKELRKNTKEAVSYVIGKTNNIEFGDFPDNKLDIVPILELTQWLEDRLRCHHDDEIVLYTHHQFDLNIDHRRCFEAAIIATRAKPNITVVCCEVPSSTGYLKPAHWEPNYYQEVSIVNVRRKIQAMQKYKSEKRAYPHPRSPEALEALARIRGVECGCKYAESFMIYKKVDQL